MAKKPKRGKPFEKGNKEWKKSSLEGRGRKPRYIEDAIANAMTAIDVGDGSLADAIMQGFAEMIRERTVGKVLVPPTAAELRDDPNAEPKLKMLPVTTKNAAAAITTGIAYLYGRPVEKVEHLGKDDLGSPLTPEQRAKASENVKKALDMKERRE